MLINILMMLIGAAFLAYGIRKKLKFWMIAGSVILGLGIVSAGVDYFTAGENGTGAVNYRLPFVLDGLVR